ncbi:MAG: helix-turn-helix transcriptional regulator [Ferruginibacter sp.]
MKNKDNNEFRNRKKFSKNFQNILAAKEITPYGFGKIFFPEKNKSTIGYYYLNNPNITIYNLCKVAIILKVDITVFFQDNLIDIIELEKVDLNIYYSLVLKNIANNIKLVRKENDELLLDLEVLSNIDSSNLSKIENAKSNLSIAILTRVADTLNTNIQGLLDWN